MSRGACFARRSSQVQPVCFNRSQAFHPAEEEGEAFSTACSVQSSGLDREVTGVEGTLGCEMGIFGLLGLITQQSSRV